MGLKNTINVKTSDIGQSSEQFLPIYQGVQSPGRPSLLSLTTMHTLDGLAIRNANRGDSRESIRTNRFAEKVLKKKPSGKSKWGLSNGGLRPLPAICAQSCAIVHFRGLL